MRGIWSAFVRLKRILIATAVLYLLSLGTGLATPYVGPAALTASLEQGNAQQAQLLELIFGGFRQSLREGRPATILTCSAVVFGINLFGAFVQFTLLGILIVPILFTVALGGWMQGVGLAGIHGSSWTAVVLFVMMGVLEWSTYVIATAAGLNVGLSVILPTRQGTSSRWQAFQKSSCDAGKMYVVIVLILAFQAVFEILYVRKVLLMGGSGIPLAPY